MFKYLYSHFMKQMKNERGTWAATAVAVVGAGASIYSANQQKKGAKDSSFDTYPEYPEAVSAREKWWNEISGYDSSNGYGAIQPNWDDIWNKAKSRISQYYWGSPTAPGAMSRLGASAARRNMQDSPSLGVLTSRLATQEGSDIANMTTAQETQRANLAESARTTFLNSLASLSGRQPSSVYLPAEDEVDVDWGGAISSLSGSVGGYIQQSNQNKWLESLFNQQRSQDSITDGPGIKSYSDY
jgi:hypothetical protein